jgi:hypothetical protein
MLKYSNRVKEQAQSEIDADEWRKSVDREKERLRNKKPWFIKRFFRAFIKTWKGLGDHGRDFP